MAVHRCFLRQITCVSGLVYEEISVACKADAFRAGPRIRTVGDAFTGTRRPEYITRIYRPAIIETNSCPPLEPPKHRAALNPQGQRTLEVEFAGPRLLFDSKAEIIDPVIKRSSSYSVPFSLVHDQCTFQRVVHRGGFPSRCAAVNPAEPGCADLAQVQRIIYKYGLQSRQHVEVFADTGRTDYNQRPFAPVETHSRKQSR